MKSNAIINFIFKAIHPFRFWIVAQFFIALILALNVWLRPFLLKLMIDRMSCAVPMQAYQMLILPALGYVGIAIAIVIVHRLYDYIMLNVSEPLKSRIGQLMMDRMMLHSHQLFQNQFSGDLAAKIKDVMSGIPDLLKIIIDKFFGHLFTILIAVGAVLVVDIKISLSLALWVLIFIISSIIFSKRAKPLFDQVARKRSFVMGSFVDILSNMMSVRLYTTRPYEHEKIRYVLDEYIAADLKRDWYLLKVYAFQGLTFIIYQITCLYLMIEGFKNGQLHSGDFVLILSINISLVENLWSLSKDIGKFAEAIGDITQGLHVALSPLEIKDAPHAAKLNITKGQIEFDDVHFNYKGSEPLFENKCVVIKPQQKVGLVGYSGSGKSTFVNLILRLYDIQYGRILIDNQDIRDVTQDSLRAAIGMIPQEPILFHRTLIENIRYGDIQATDAQVMDAAQRAHAHEFIQKMPQGYNTLIGERGVKLSGGQRQRIAIARAILKNAPILMLDEATSALDSIIEGYIQESLAELMQGKTTLVIAHRLSTLFNMDRILVFDNGVIVQDGTHQELLAQDGLYKKLCNAQTEGFLPDKNDMIVA